MIIVQVLLEFLHGLVHFFTFTSVFMFFLGLPGAAMFLLAAAIMLAMIYVARSM